MQIKPRDYQIEAIESSLIGFQNADRGQLIMACGTGKTVTTFWLKERIEANLTLFLVPCLSLITQAIKEWQNASNSVINFLCVCSDYTVVEKQEYDDANLDNKHPVTSSVSEIESFMEQDNTRVIFATYQSLELVMQAQHNVKVAIDLGIFDEAHKCAGNKDRLFSLCLDAEKLLIKKRLFVTATPRIYKANTHNKAFEEAVVSVGMDDEAVFGKQFYILSFQQAIEKGLLSDYKVLVIGVDQAAVDTVAKNRVIQNQTGELFDAQVVASQIAMLKAIKKHKLSKIISFHTTIKGAKKFSDTLAYIQQETQDYLELNSNISATYISGSMSVKNRKVQLDALQQANHNNVKIISNARCLSEGVNIPALDAIAFMDSKNSEIDIVQAVGRVMRKHPDKQDGVIILPVFVSNEDKQAEANIEFSQYKQVFSVINALRSHDGALSDSLNKVRFKQGYDDERTIINQAIPQVILDFSDGVAESFIESFSAKLIDRTSSSWNFWYGLLIKYIKHNGNSFVPKLHNTSDGFNLGQWVGTQRRNYNKGQLSVDRIKKLEALQGWSWNVLEDAWDKGYQETVKYIKQHGDGLVPNQYQTSDHYKLGYWVSNQKERYRQGKLSGDKIEKLEALQGWSWNVLEDVWDKGYQETVKYIKQHGDGLVHTSYKVSDGYKLGIWVSKQRIAYNQGKLSLDKTEKLEALQGWSWNPLEDAWDKGYQETVKYIKQHGHGLVPTRYQTSDGYKLSIWVSEQKKRYRKGQLRADRIKKLEELQGWFWHTLVEDAWDKGYQETVKYIKQNCDGLVPYSYKTSDDYKLGQWVSKQRTAYSQGKLSLDRLKKLEELNGWAWRLEAKK